MTFSVLRRDGADLVVHYHGTDRRKAESIYRRLSRYIRRGTLLLKDGDLTVERTRTYPRRTTV